MELSKDKALFLYGERGAGKTTLARKVAQKYGVYDTIEMHNLHSIFSIAQFLVPTPKVLIVEKFMSSKKNVEIIKALITSQYMKGERRGFEPIIIDMPYFIICSGQERLQGKIKESRRFEPFEVIKGVTNGIHP